MCGRFTLTTSDARGLACTVGAELSDDYAALYRPRYNIAPSDLHLLVRLEGGRRTIVPACWGIVTSHAPLLINARAESASELPTFREAFRTRRCVVPADGFFEWYGRAGARHPIWFHAPDRALIYFAGLFEEDDDRRDFVILTTTANALVAPVHDRMPVVLTLERAVEWLAAPRADLLRPCPEGTLAFTEVSARVNSVTNDDPECLRPEPPRQLKLL